MAPTCKVGGCSNPLPGELRGSALCLQHFLDDIEERSRNFNRGLADGPEEPLRDAALRFAMLTAAKIATLGVNSPPEDDLLRERLLHAMLLLVDLRDRAERGVAA